MINSNKLIINSNKLIINSNKQKSLKECKKFYFSVAFINIPGSGALMTFKESNWLMSIVVAAQPHFKGQTEDETIFWAYGCSIPTKSNG